MLNVIVLIAMAVIATAFAAGLIVQAGLPLVPSLIGTVALFLVMAASFFGIGKAKSGGGGDRIDEIEEALEIIDGDLQRLDRVEDGVSRIDGLSDRVEQLGEAVSGGAPGAAGFEGEGFAEKLKDIYARIEAVREDVATENRSERDKIAGELGALEGMIKRVSGDLAAASASGAGLAVSHASSSEPAVVETASVSEATSVSETGSAFVLEPSPELETVETLEAEEELVLVEASEPDQGAVSEVTQEQETGEQDALALDVEAGAPDDAAEREDVLLAAATLAEDPAGAEGLAGAEDTAEAEGLAEAEDLSGPGTEGPETVETETEGGAAGAADTEVVKSSEAELNEAETTAPAFSAAAAVIDDDDDDTAMLDTIRKGIEQGRVDLYLQPTVTLPDRKVRYFEALTRIRKEDDRLVMPGDYMPVAKRSALMPLIDNVLVVRSVQVLRRLGPDTAIKGVFANVSMHSLLDPDYFPELIEFMEENNGLSEHLIFQISQSEMQGLTESELSCLDTLGALGFKFCLGNVGDMDADFSSLSERYFRYLKVGAGMFLGGPGRNAADLKRRVDGLGIVLIIEKVEKETGVADLLDHGIEFAQGHLFAEAQPMNEALSKELENAGAT